MQTAAMPIDPELAPIKTGQSKGIAKISKRMELKEKKESRAAEAQARFEAQTQLFDK